MLGKRWNTDGTLRLKAIRSLEKIFFMKTKIHWKIGIVCRRLLKRVAVLILVNKILAFIPKLFFFRYLSFIICTYVYNMLVFNKEVPQRQRLLNKIRHKSALKVAAQTYIFY